MSLFLFAFQKHFKKKLFFLYFKLIFFGVFKSFLFADVKNNFLKIKKILFLCISERKKHFEKQQQPHPQTPMNS
jgi:hypothetical protein